MVFRAVVDCLVKGYCNELQIIENNNAADPEADLSDNSAAWKAILPNASDDGYTLVAPGTTGTLHWNWLNSKITLDTAIPTYDNEHRGTYFKDLAVNSANLPHIPYIVRELGLFPTSGSTMKGYYYMQFTADERFPRACGVLKVVWIALSIVLSTAFLVNSTYNPFLYLRF